MPSKALIVVFAAALAVAAPAGARLAADHLSLPDAVGDGDPDITMVSAGSNASGGLTFIVEIGNRTELNEDEYIQVFIDSDHNPATGELPHGGADFALQMDDSSVGLFRWDSVDFVPAANSSVYGYVFHGFRLGLLMEDIGSPTGSINYSAVTISGDQGDDAPDGHLANLPLSTTPLHLTVASLAVGAKTVKAGKRFSVAMKVNRSDLEEITSAGLPRCSATFGKKTVKVRIDFPEDVVVCFGTAPKAAKGKTIKVTESLELDGVKVSRVASVKVH